MSPSMRQKGFSIVAAIFLVVILSALGAFMVSLSTTQHIASTLDVRGARAYQAARAGIEWAAWQGIRNAAAFACATAGASTSTINFPGDLADFTTTVACTSGTYDEDGNTVRVYSVTSTARSGVAGSVQYVERVVTGTFSACTAPGGGAC